MEALAILASTFQLFEEFVCPIMGSTLLFWLVGFGCGGKKDKTEKS